MMEQWKLTPVHDPRIPEYTDAYNKECVLDVISSRWFDKKDLKSRLDRWLKAHQQLATVWLPTIFAAGVLVGNLGFYLPTYSSWLCPIGFLMTVPTNILFVVRMRPYFLKLLLLHSFDYSYISTINVLIFMNMLMIISPTGIAAPDARILGFLLLWIGIQITTSYDPWSHEDRKAAVASLISGILSFTFGGAIFQMRLMPMLYDRSFPVLNHQYKSLDILGNLLYTVALFYVKSLFNIYSLHQARKVHPQSFNEKDAESRPTVLISTISVRLALVMKGIPKERVVDQENLHGREAQPSFYTWKNCVRFTDKCRSLLKLGLCTVSLTLSLVITAACILERSALQQVGYVCLLLFSGIVLLTIKSQLDTTLLKLTWRSFDALYLSLQATLTSGFLLALFTKEGDYRALGIVAGWLVVHIAICFDAVIFLAARPSIKRLLGGFLWLVIVLYQVYILICVHDTKRWKETADPQVYFPEVVSVIRSRVTPDSDFKTISLYNVIAWRMVYLLISTIRVLWRVAIHPNQLTFAHTSFTYRVPLDVPAASRSAKQ